LRSLARFFGVLSLMLAFSLSTGGLNPALASSLLFDRGLPTTNLNNAAGADRCNVAWAYGDYYIPNPSSYTTYGDDFSIGSSGSTYHLDKITLWTVDYPIIPEYKLLGGPAGGPIVVQSSNYTIQQDACYPDGVTPYQSFVSPYEQYSLYKVDFTVDWTVEGGKKYQFFIDTTTGVLNFNGEYYTSFLHASNAALSGSPQEGANNQLLCLTIINNGSPDYNSSGSVTSWDSDGNGWNKSSDANVQIYGTPLPPSLWLFGSGLAGLGLWRLKKRFKA
jgi:hypothetical protein